MWNLKVFNCSIINIGHGEVTGQQWNVYRLYFVYSFIPKLYIVLLK